MNGICPAETSLISFSLYLLELFGFSLVTFSVLLHSTVFYSVQTWHAQLLGWFELVLLAGEVLPFTCAREKGSGLADPTSSQEAEPDGNWPLVCLLLGFFNLCQLPHPLLLAAVTLVPAQRGERGGMGEVEMLPLEVTPA